MRGHQNNPQTPTILRRRDRASGFEIHGTATNNYFFYLLIKIDFIVKIHVSSIFEQNHEKQALDGSMF